MIAKLIEKILETGSLDFEPQTQKPLGNSVDIITESPWRYGDRIGTKAKVKVKLTGYRMPDAKAMGYKLEELLSMGCVPFHLKGRRFFVVKLESGSNCFDYAGTYTFCFVIGVVEEAV